MFHRLILQVTKFRVPPPKRLNTVVKNILGGHHAPPKCQIGFKTLPPQKGMSKLKFNVLFLKTTGTVLYAES